MKVLILSIGNELLSGRTLNTNATWLGRELTSVGCVVKTQIVVPDDKSSIMTILNELIDQDKKECLLLTGGLGPTDDDVTRESLFEFVGSDSKFDSEYWNHLSYRFDKFGMAIPESNRNQALVPLDGDIIDNPIGSARGFKFIMGQTVLISLPGVPSEMKAMARASVLPWLKVRSKQEVHSMTICTTGIPESALIEKIRIPIQNDHGCEVGYYPSLFGVDIRINSNDNSAKEFLVKEITSLLGDNVFAMDNNKLEDAVVKLALEQNISLSFAESCTGGLIGHRVTEVSGSSKVFKGSAVVYCNNSKIDILGVNKDSIEKYGAVSEQTAKEMAEKVRLMFSSDIGLSVTGIAGPGGGTDDKPVGLVYIGFSSADKIMVRKFNLGSGRSKNKLRTSQVALNLLRLEMDNV